MRFRMLGPLRVWDGLAWSPVRAAQQRIVLAVLLTRAGQQVSAERLVDEIWGESPPRAALSTVQGYVMRLRRLLGDGASVVTRGSGYELVVDAAEVDAMVFERLIETGRRAWADGRVGDAAARFGEALALWHGPALADVPPGPTVSVEATRLEQSRLSVLEERLDAELELGHHAEIVDELLRLVDEHPLRERLWRLLMLALYRCGRRAEALDAYRRAHRVLAAELGIEPGPDLRRIEEAIIADDHELAAPARALVPAQLPADVAGFTGRDSYLKQLDTLLLGDSDPHPVLMISALDGAAGVGKTALAVHWAQQVRDRFPDGQLHVNLRGYAADQPLRPIDALARFLPALGVPADQMPGDLDEAAALYRSVLAGRRMLILLDNANHPDQVRPLLPGSPGCLVLVTSRDRLGGLVARDGAVRLALDVLAPDEAESLLAELLDAERVAREPAAAAELVRLCGYLPLALRIVAANLSAHPRRTIAGYVADLAGVGRLAALEVPGDPQASVRPAFERSYAALPADAREMFRLLGRVPGPDITVPAVAALVGTAPGPAGRLLDRLAAAHLVEEHTDGRYALHDLIRLYAAEQPENSGPALARLYDFYLRGVDAAARRLYPEMLRLALPRARFAAAVPVFDDHTDALAWLDAERANLAAAVRAAASHGPRQAAWRLADAVRGYLYIGVHTVDWNDVGRIGLAAAEADGDLRGQAAAHLSLATLRGLQERSGEAIDHDDAARSLSRRVGWDLGESAALGHLAVVRRRLGQLRKASEHLTAALAIDRRTGWRAGEATKLANLGVVSLGLGRLSTAIRYYTEALTLQRQARSRTGEARSMTSLGELYHLTGRTGDAATTLTDALDLHRETGDRIAEAYTLWVLARVRHDTGEPAAAADLAAAAADLARATGDRRVEANALTVLAALGQSHQQTIERHRHTLELACEIGDHFGQAEALVGLAAAHHQAGHLGQTADHARTALAIARHGDYRLLEGQALTILAAVRLHQHRTDRAAGHARHAIAIHAETGHRLGQARAHLIAHAALTAAGHPTEAATHHHQAQSLLTTIGANPT